MHTISRSSEEVYVAIRQALEQTRYADGAYLREAQLAQQLGVSRTPVREALRRLGAEGWLEVRPNYGARVKRWSLRDVEEIFEARLLIEPYLAGRAAAHITADEIERLTQLATQMRAIADGPPGEQTTEAWFAANASFHAIITAAARNERLDQSLKSMKEMPLIKWTFDTFSAEDRERSTRQHFEIVTALAERNTPWAEAVTRCHIAAAEKSVLDRLRGNS